MCGRDRAYETMAHHAGVTDPPRPHVTRLVEFRCLPNVSVLFCRGRVPWRMRLPRSSWVSSSASSSAMLIFAGSSDRRLDEQAARTADTAPAVVSASADLERTRQARTALDDAVVDASRQRDEALVVARCEVNPSAACPQTHITGVPGAGPEHRTADEFLADTQAQLDKAVVERDRLAPSLDAAVADDEQKLAQARDAAIATADRGFGARWLAMNAHTLASPAATVLRALLTGLFIALFLFPLLLRLSRAKTTEDRRTAAIAAQERADLEADTAIAVKKAEVRAAIETMRAEQELASARMEIEAQNEIDREEQRRRVAAAIEAPTQVTSERVPRSSPSWSRPDESVDDVGKPARADRVSDGREALVDPGAAGRGGGGGALDASVRAAGRRQRDRDDDAAAARCASGVRGDRGDPLQPSAQPPGECDVRGDG